VAQIDDAVTLEEVVKLARQLSPLDQVRLIESVAPEVERALAMGKGTKGRSLLGILKDLGLAPSAEEIDAVRREAWSNFPRDHI
jgi:hypothetical protein